MEQFSLEKYFENPTRKVVTRNGKTVRIVCWDKLGEYPIIGCVKYSDDYEDLESYDINGFKYSFDREDQNDLFFADEEKELTEFEKAIKKLIESCCNEVEEANITNAGAKEISSHILDLARKEIEKENPYNGKQKQEWSKEDSERLARIHKFIWANRKGDTDEIYQQEQDADWLMSLIPQQNQYDKGYNDGYSAAKYNQWKPTDKQMEDFRMLLDYNIGVFDYAKFMSADSLYEDLKKNLID